MSLFNRLRVGDYCIYDINNIQGLKKHQPTVVRIVDEGDSGYYICTPIEPLVYPIQKNGYAAQLIRIHKSMLTKKKIDKEIVIRLPVNMPVINRKDLKVIRSILDNKAINKDDLLKLYYKLAYYESFDINSEGMGNDI